jgi:hypothetical protein
MNKAKKQLLIHCMYTFSIAIFSALLVLYAYDLSNGEAIENSTTNRGKQDLLISIAKLLGVYGSLVIGILATGGSLLYTIVQYRNEPK